MPEYVWSCVYGPCSVPCGSGYQECTVDCVVNDGSGKIVNDAYCTSESLPKPPSGSSCNTPKCGIYYDLILYFKVNLTDNINININFFLYCFQIRSIFLGSVEIGVLVQPRVALVI
jgi:hypothetical protein